MDTKQLKEFFKKHDFNVYLFEQENIDCAELKTWTKGGVNMIICLIPFTKEEFIFYVNNFDINEEIELHRQDKLYKSHFTIKELLNDFEAFLERLKSVKEAIELL